jgi:hypothetical protein
MLYSVRAVWDQFRISGEDRIRRASSSSPPLLIIIIIIIILSFSRVRTVWYQFRISGEDQVKMDKINEIAKKRMRKGEVSLLGTSKSLGSTYSNRT